MRVSTTLRTILLALLLPAAAAAQDAGPTDAGPEDAAVPDASAGDETGERCLDGYDRSYVDACSGKSIGAVCTFPGGESGQCAALRCLDAAGQPIATCVATTGMPAPAPVLRDAGLAEGDAAPGTEVLGAEGGGCSVGAAPGALVWPWLVFVAAMGCRKRPRTAPLRPSSRV